jgi:hypothetical protein
MLKLYLFPIEAESRDLARQYSEQIVEEIRHSYPLLCEYLEPADSVNISSERNNVQFVQFEPPIQSAFQTSDVAKSHANVRDLVSVVTSALNGKGVKHKSPMEFPI